MATEDGERSSLEQTAASARETAERLAQSAKQEAQEALGDAHTFLKRQWQERPLTVAAVAVGIGALIGLALSRKS